MIISRSDECLCMCTIDTSWHTGNDTVARLQMKVIKLKFKKVVMYVWMVRHSRHAD